MDAPLFPQLPFLTREMLKFGRKSNLELQVISQATRAEVLLVSGVTREGPFTYAHQTVNDRGPVTTTHKIADIPIMLGVSNKDLDAIQGEIYVTVNLLIDGNIVQQLCAGLVYAQKSISFPTTNAQDIRPGGGLINQYSGSNPAAGANASIVVPTGAVWRIQSIQVTLVTDANVANRRMHLYVLPLNGEDQLEVFSDVDHAESLTRKYYFAPFGVIPDTIDDNDIMVPFPSDIYLEGDGSIGTALLNKQAGDNLTALNVHVEEWFQPT